MGAGLPNCPQIIFPSSPTNATPDCPPDRPPNHPSIQSHKRHPRLPTGSPRRPSPIASQTTPKRPPNKPLQSVNIPLQLQQCIEDPVLWDTLMCFLSALGKCVGDVWRQRVQPKIDCYPPKGAQSCPKGAPELPWVCPNPPPIRYCRWR